MKLQELLNELAPTDTRLIAVSKKKPNEIILDFHEQGQLDFGENRVQELTDKYEALPKDIRWHFVGHLQTNKIKYIAPFIHLIHSVDRLKVLKEINKRARQNERVIDCLLQFHIAAEESKFGFDGTKPTQPSNQKLTPIWSTCALSASWVWLPLRTIMPKYAASFST